jgi:16S rRNA (cytosine967-C5)-methyltransferase
MHALFVDKVLPVKPINARQLALKICHSVLTQGQSLSSQLDRQLAQLDDPRDQGLCSELCYGFCRYYFVLSAALKPLLKKPLKGKDVDIQVILVLGLYQIRFMRVDDHAAVNETVNLVLRQKKSWAKGLVNAVLRNYLRQIPSDPSERQQLTEQEQQIAYPQWMREQMINDWGPDASTVFEAANRAPPMMLRVDLTQTTREEYLHILADSQVEASAHALIPTAIILQQARAVDQIPGFDDAQVSVQDAAAQIAAPLLDCRPGMRVLDACAAPGGKTLHILQATSDLDLVALDQDANRLQRVAQNLQRAGQQAKLICADAAQTDSWFDGEPFDRILLDAPCSASGIIRRHPDIRLLRKAADISQLVQLQARLLDAMWKLLKPGGQMLYSTCSIFRAENELQIAAFIERQSDCMETPVNSVQWGRQRPHGRQILPGFNDMDGFFYALLEKRG